MSLIVLAHTQKAGLGKNRKISMRTIEKHGCDALFQEPMENVIVEVNVLD